jgi:hypothetical protein
VGKTNQPTKYFVSRQHYWHSGQRAVEIAQGGIESASPDMLVEKYRNLGEGDEFVDPREAVKAALAIANKWREVEFGVKLVFGQNLDLVCADPVSYNEAKRTFPKIAQRLYDAAPKCARCGELIEECFHVADLDEDFCSENHAQLAYEEVFCQEESEEEDESEQ